MANRKFLEEFIEIIKEEISIWQSKSDAYKDKHQKQKSWEKLLRKWQELDKTATIDVVKKKYQSMRACYRRELLKQRKSEKSGAGTEDIYIPTLWYFENLEFLRDQEIQLEGISTMDESFEENITQEPSAKRKKFDPSIFLETAVSHLRNPDKKTNRDEANIHGESWITTYRSLSAEQKIFAKKVIDEALMYGQLGNLCLSSSVNLGIKHIPRYAHQSNSNSAYSNFSSSSPVGPSSPSSPHFSHSTFPAQASHRNALQPIHIISNELINTSNSHNAFQELFNDQEFQ